jgi:hypothetical protein
MLNAYLPNWLNVLSLWFMRANFSKFQVMVRFALQILPADSPKGLKM